jgi:hypothetical protein
MSLLHPTATRSNAEYNLLFVTKSEHKISGKRPELFYSARLPSTPRPTAIGASDAHECNSLPPIHGLHIETSTAAALAVIVGCFVLHNIMQWLQEFKPMAKDITVSHHSATGCECCRKFDLEFDDLSHLQFNWQERRHA